MATEVATWSALVDRGRVVLADGSRRVPTGVSAASGAEVWLEADGEALDLTVRQAGVTERVRLRRSAAVRVEVVDRSGPVALEPGQTLERRADGYAVREGGCALPLGARGARPPLEPPLGRPTADVRVGAPPPAGATHVAFAAPAYAPLSATTLRLEAAASVSASLWLDERGFDVALPPGGASWPLPGPVRCAGLVTQAPVATSIGFAQGTPAEIAGRLVAELAVEGARADDAIGSLARLGDAALGALEATFPDATGAERRRILRAAAGLVRTTPNALRLFVAALESGDPALEEDTLEATRALGRPGLAVLEAAVERGHVGAARPLAERAPERACAALAIALEATHDDARLRAIRSAVAVASGRSPEGRMRLLALAARTEDADLAAFLLGATGPSETSADAARAVCARSADHVPSALRCLESLHLTGLGVDPTAAEALTRGTTHEVWMVRAAAYAALGRSGRVVEVVPALEDEMPRVRAAAIAVLAHHAPALRRIAELARRDPHALVRLEADRVLLDHPDAEALVLAALRDRSTRVRVGLYEALAARRDARFTGAAREALTGMRGSTPSLVAAARYLGSLCDEAHVDVLEARVDAGREGASERLRAVALAAATALAELPSPRAAAAAARFLGPAPAERTPRCGR